MSTLEDAGKKSPAKPKRTILERTADGLRKRRAKLKPNYEEYLKVDRMLKALEEDAGVSFGSSEADEKKWIEAIRNNPSLSINGIQKIAQVKDPYVLNQRLVDARKINKINGLLTVFEEN